MGSFRIRWVGPEMGWGLFAGPSGVPKGTVLPYEGVRVAGRGTPAT